MSFKQAGRLIQFSSPAGADVLLANSIDGVEGVSRLYSFHVELLAVRGTVIDATAIVGNKACLSLALLGAQGNRYFNGLVASFEVNPGVDSFDSYTARLVPSLWQLTLATNCRVFQSKTVMDIIKEVISPYALSVGDVTTFAYQPLDYCTQYNETDFAFISRLAEQYGIFYWFEHSLNDNKVIFGDSLSAYGACPLLSEVPYVAKEHDRETMYRSVVSDFRLTAAMVTGQHTSYDWDFRTFQVGKPASQASTQDVGKNAFERYSWPGGDSGYTKLTDKQVLTPAHSPQFILAQTQASDVNAQMFHGTASARSLTAGYTFTLQEHVNTAWNKGYYLTEIAHRAVQSPSYENEGFSDPDPYSNRFVAIKSDSLFRPEYRTPKPKMYGVQNAIVVAPSGEDIYIDKYGRVNVRFVWDRTANFHGTDNTWVRVAQPWAGPRTGTYFWPRINDEVLIQFVDGDPDDPILIGSVYNANAMPKYALPDMSTRTGIFTRSSKGGGVANANELRFEDKAGSEQIFINAEKDLDLMVENDRRTHVKGQDSLIVDKDQLEHVDGNYNRSIKGDYVESIGGKQDVAITGAVTHKYAAAYSLDVGSDSISHVTGKQSIKADSDMIHKIGGDFSQNITGQHQVKNASFASQSEQTVYIKGGMTVVIEAGLQLSLKAGGNFIDIGPTGVSISGTMVLINSGGAAASGTAPNPPDAADTTTPASPGDPDKADDGTKGGKM